MNIAQSKTMTNTPMTFEEWYAQHDSLAEYSAKQAWEASEANQQAEMDALKYDLDGYMKIAHASATEIVQQAQTIAELVEALEDAQESLARFTSDEGSTQKDFDTCDHVHSVLAKVKGK